MTIAISKMSNRSQHNADLENMKKGIKVDANEVIVRLKTSTNTKTDVDLAIYFEVSNKAISSWRTRNSIPLEFLLQACAGTGEKIDYFLFGEAFPRQQTGFPDSGIDDFRITTMKLTGERILIEILEKHAPEELAFMEPKETLAEGESIGMAMLIFADYIEREKKALVDSGRMTNDEFKEYIRNVDCYDLPYFARAFKHRNKQGPQ
ncbi:MAG: helix-turn-helix domain-containing protein [Hoeflea sp.]|uniref:helix-turn-helix domain-containing protein n=1 Tax=Hoeflea sp. TaxID=1940281 RepID=UPI0032974DB8